MTLPAAIASLAAILDTTAHVLLDFDGPVCNVFAGYPAHDIADELRHLLTDGHHLDLPDDVQTTRDPLHVIHRTADLAPHLWATADTALRAAEVQAITTATPAPGAAEFLAACQATARPVAIVSNNSAEAVTTYLRLHNLTPLVTHVQGRDARHPGLMKPNPYSLHQALTALDAKPGGAVLIGDSLTDLDAARAAGVRVIAYANTPSKLTALAHADAVTTSMQTLADTIR
jgi:phosphoglycolate phosphatase